MSLLLLPLLFFDTFSPSSSSSHFFARSPGSCKNKTWHVHKSPETFDRMTRLLSSDIGIPTVLLKKKINKNLLPTLLCSINLDSSSNNSLNSTVLTQDFQKNESMQTCDPENTKDLYMLRKLMQIDRFSFWEVRFARHKNTQNSTSFPVPRKTKR